MELTSEVQQRVEELLHAGLSDVAVQRATGVHRSTVARYRKRWGIAGYLISEDSPACRHGHPFPENATRAYDGWLRCTACARERERTYAAAAYVPVQPDEPDEIAIERAVCGEPPARLTSRERAAAVRALAARRHPAPVIADRVGCHVRTVYRIKQQQGVTA